MSEENLRKLSLEDISDIEDGGNPNCMSGGNPISSLSLEPVSDSIPSIMHVIPGVLYYAFVVVDRYLIYYSSMVEAEAVDIVRRKSEEMTGDKLDVNDITVIEFLPSQTEN